MDKSCSRVPPDKSPLRPKRIPYKLPQKPELKPQPIEVKPEFSDERYNKEMAERERKKYDA